MLRRITQRAAQAAKDGSQWQAKRGHWKSTSEKCWRPVGTQGISVALTGLDILGACDQWLRAHYVSRLPLATICRRWRGSLTGFFNAATYRILRNTSEIKVAASKLRHHL